MHQPKQFRLKSIFAITVTLGFANLGITPDTQAETFRKHTNGVGVIFGDPTGLTAKFWQSSNIAYDVGLAYSFGDYLLVYGDYLWHFPGVFPSSPSFFAHLTPYLGGGAGVIFASSGSSGRKKIFEGSTSSIGVGVRIPLGLEWTPGSPPIGVFAELVPGVGVIPSVYSFVNGGIGIRYYF